MTQAKSPNFKVDSRYLDCSLQYLTHFFHCECIWLTRRGFVGIKSNLPDHLIIFFVVKEDFPFAANKNVQASTCEMRTLKFQNQLFPSAGSFSAGSSRA